MLKNRLIREIAWGDCDPAGIVFNPNYSIWFDHATNKLYEAAGFSKLDLLRVYDIVGCPIVSSDLRFKRPCFFCDIVEIESNILGVGNSSFSVKHTLRNVAKKEVCVEAVDVRVWTVRDPKSGDISKSDIPNDFRSVLLGEHTS